MTIAEPGRPRPASRPARRPLVDPARAAPRVVHFGLGAFHRAHQAVYTENAAARSGEPWGIVAVAPRSAATVDAMRAQDCLYSVTERAPGRPTAPGWSARRRRPGHAARTPRGSTSCSPTPRSRAVTLTVTEKGYSPRARTGGAGHRRARRRAPTWPRPRPDGAGPRHGRRPAGRRAGRAVAGRRRPDRRRVLRQHGRQRRRAGRAWCASSSRRRRGRTGEPVLDWLATSVGFPATIVDRIVPATTPARPRRPPPPRSACATRCRSSASRTGSGCCRTPSSPPRPPLGARRRARRRRTSRPTS